jgi:hypothetical protein
MSDKTVVFKTDKKKKVIFKGLGGEAETKPVTLPAGGKVRMGEKLATRMQEVQTGKPHIGPKEMTIKLKPGYERGKGKGPRKEEPRYRHPGGGRKIYTGRAN